MSQDYGPSIEIDPIYKFLHQGKVEQRECLAVVCWVWDSGVKRLSEFDVNMFRWSEFVVVPSTTTC